MLAKLPGVEMGGRMRGNIAKGVGTLLAIVAGLLAFTYWPEQGQVFGRPPAEVRRTLEGLDLPPHVFGSEPKKVKVLTPSPKTMVWSITENEDEEMRYVVTLAAEGAGATRVMVDVTGPTKGPLGDVAARMARNRAIRNLYVIAMKEQIAAALEQRSFQTIKIVLPTVIAVFVAATSSRLDSAGGSPPRRN
jgi:hypothetical protein